MADAIIQQGHLTQAEFDANPTLVLEDGQIVWLKDNSGNFKKGDGVTQLSALPFLGNGNQNLAQVLTNGNSTGGNNIESPDGLKALLVSDAMTALQYNSGVKSAAIYTDDTNTTIQDTQEINLSSDSVKKNGVEVATINDLPTVPTNTSDLTNDGSNGTNPFITALDLPNFEGLKSGGAITVGTFGGSGVDNDIRVSAASWVVGTTYYSTAIDTDFLDIALSSAGLQRYVGLYGTTSNTITKVEGSEAALATYPTTPANSIVIGYVLVNDASASATPDLSGYLLKLDKATQATNTTGTNDTTYVTPLANAIKQNLLISGTNIKTVNGTSILGSGNIVISGSIIEHSSGAFSYAPADNSYTYIGYTQLGAGGYANKLSNIIRNIASPFTGTIAGVILTTYNASPQATSTESSTLTLRNCTTLVDYDNLLTYTNNWSTAATLQKSVQSFSLNIPVTRGDLLLSIINNPAWATNPTSVQTTIQYIIT